MSLEPSANLVGSPKGNGHNNLSWQKVALLSTIFLCATLLLLWPGVPAAGVTTFFTLSLAVVYFVFHIGSPPLPPLGA